MPRRPPELSSELDVLGFCGFASVIVISGERVYLVLCVVEGLTTGFESGIELNI